MTDSVKFIIKAFIRKGLTLLGGALLGYGVFTDEEAGSFVDKYLEEVLGLVLLGISSVWTWAYQRYVKAKIVTALALPPSATSEQLEKATAARQGAE